MPELPEVENFRKYVEDTALGQKILVAKLASPGKTMLIDTGPRDLINALEGNTFTDTFRHGKFLFIKLSKSGYLMLHFGMTGDLIYNALDPKLPKAYILMIRFINGKSLLFSDSRRLGRIALVESVEGFVFQRGYGPDALNISETEFTALFQKRKVVVKTVLMNQKIIAGVGNEFSDAILFEARIHPLSISGNLTVSQLKKIYRVMVKMLKEAVSHDADRSKVDHYFFLNHRKAGLTCPNCKGKTAFKTIGGRSSYFCPVCQKKH